MLCLECIEAEPDKVPSTPGKSLLPMGLGRSSKAEDIVRTKFCFSLVFAFSELSHIFLEAVDQKKER